MFVKINKRRDKHGEMTYTASIMRSDRVKGKVVQTTVAYIGRVEEDQIPYLKAAYAKKKPRLVWSGLTSPNNGTQKDMVKSILYYARTRYTLGDRRKGSL